MWFQLVKFTKFEYRLPNSWNTNKHLFKANIISSTKVDKSKFIASSDNAKKADFTFTIL